MGGAPRLTRPLLGFSRERFAARRRSAFARLGEGALLVPATPVLLRSGDSELRYRPDADLFYLTGLTEPEALLLLLASGGEERTLLFVRPRDAVAERWSGARLGPEGVRDLTGIDEVRSIEEVATLLPELVARVPRLFYRLGASARLDRAIREILATARRRGPRSGDGPRALIDPGELLHELRLRKDPEEIEALREAAQITVESFRDALALVRGGVGEWEIEAALEGGFRRRGALAPAFGTIVGGGAHACTLHYTENSGYLRDGALVLIDAGAEVALYAGDITRTVPVSGQFTPEQRALYEVVEGARRGAVERAGPGVTLQELHTGVVRTLTEGLRELGLLRGSLDELLDEGAHTPFYPHSTSHWLGLNTHDVGDYMVDGVPRALEPSMVFTVEPGLYIPLGAGHPAGWEGIGIRIEDDLLITEGGCELLTGSLPTSPDEVELLVRGGA